MEEIEFHKFFNLPKNLDNATNKELENVWEVFPKELFKSIRRQFKTDEKSITVTIPKNTYLYHGTESAEFASNPKASLNFKTFFGCFPAVAFWFSLRRGKDKIGYLIQWQTTCPLTVTIVPQSISSTPNKEERCVPDGCIGRMVTQILCPGKGGIRTVSENDYIELVLTDKALLECLIPLRSFEIDLNLLRKNCDIYETFQLFRSIIRVYSDFTKNYIENKNDKEEVKFGFKSLENFVFCHGHAHKEPKFPSRFTLVDVEKVNRPDIVADFLSSTFLSKLPDSSVDVMIFMSCPYDLYSRANDQREYLNPFFVKLLKKLRKNGKALFLQSWKLKDDEWWESQEAHDRRKFQDNWKLIKGLNLKPFSENDGKMEHKFIMTKDWLYPILKVWKTLGLKFKYKILDEKVWNNKYGLILKRV